MQNKEKMSERELFKLNSQIEEVESIGNWRNIIFVPFYDTFRWILTISICMEISIVIYDEVYDIRISYEIFLKIVYYCAELIYLFDTVISIMHRNMKMHAKLDVFTPRNLAALTFDVLSLIPIYEGFLLVNSSMRKQDENESLDIYKIKSFIRIYRVFFFFNEKRKCVGVNQVVIVTIRHAVQFVMGTLLVSSLWYKMGCWLCVKKNWMIHLNDHTFDTEKKFEWFVICFCEMGNRIMHNSTGLIRATTIWEHIVICVAMLVGYLTHVTMYNALLTASFLKVFMKQFEYRKHLREIMLLMQDWGISASVRRKVRAYYGHIWQVQRGISQRPSIFTKLPMAMQKEVTLDLFWEAMRHTHLLSHMDIAFKRAISYVMLSETHLSGHYLLKVNQRINKLYFIVSGIVQVLSDEDNESPIMSFSSGSIIGEVSGIMNCYSCASIRCATNVEVYVLNYRDLYRTLTFGFRNRTKLIRSHIRNRIENAKDLQSIIKFNYEVRGYEASSKNFKWIKDRWRKIMKHEEKGVVIDIESVRNDININHTSEFLDLIVLSTDVDLKMAAICLTDKFPFVFEANSGFRRFWDYVHLISIIALSLVNPYLASFERKCSPAVLRYLMVPEIVCFLDILVQLSTAIYDETQHITQSLQIAIHCCKRVTFLIDIFASFPFHYFVNIAGFDEHIVAIWRLNICFKMYRLFVLLIQNDNDLSFKIIHLVGKYIILYVLLGFWLMCLAHAFACYDPDCDLGSWYIQNIRADGVFGAAHELPRQLQMMYYVCSIYLGIGGTDRYQFSLFDTIFCHVMGLIGYFMFSFCFSQLCAATVHSIQDSINYKEQLLGITKTMQSSQVRCASHKNEVIQYFSFLWHFSKGVDYSHANDLFQDCPRVLFDQVISQRILQVLQKSIIFEGCSTYFLNCLAHHSVCRVLPSNIQVLRMGQSAQYIHIVIRGYVKIISHMAGDEQRKSTQIRTTGTALGIIEALHNINLFTDAYSMTEVEICSIQRLYLNQLYKVFPEEFVVIKETLNLHMIKNKGALMRLGGRLPAMYALEKPLGKGDMFTYEVYDYKDDFARIQYMRPFLTLGRWKFLRYCLRKNTIDPQSDWFLIYEMFKCFTIIITVVLHVIGDVFNSAMLYISYIQIVVNLTSVPDMYIRLHCQYYNSYGILVSHPLKTAIRYITTSFIVDLVSTIAVLVVHTKHVGGTSEKSIGITMIVVMKFLQSYRIYGLLLYYETDADWRKSIFLAWIKYSLCFVMIILTCACLNEDFSCKHESSGVTVCDRDSWLGQSLFQNETRTDRIFLFSMYVVFTNFTSCLTGVFPTITALEIMWFLSLFCIGFMIRWCLLAYMTSHAIVGNKELIIYRSHLSAFVAFMDGENVDESLTEATTTYYEHVWRRTRGNAITGIFNKVDKGLHATMAYEMYGDTIKNIGLFRNVQISFLKSMCMHVSPLYYLKGTEILRCNDIQHQIFIVHSGSVDIEIANCVITSLGQGGTFGNFSMNAYTRQTIKVVTRTHTDLLVLDNVLFRRIVQDMPKIWNQVQQLNALNAEYFEPIRNVIEEVTSQEEGVIFTTKNKCWAFITWTLDEENKYYSILRYMLCVHIAPISTIITSYFIFISSAVLLRTTASKIFIYSCDVIFLFYFYVKCNIRYVDVETGQYHSRHWKIFKRYLKGGFFVDIVSVLPLELFYYSDYFKMNHEYLLANRCLRIYLLEAYFNDCKNKLSVTLLLKTFHIFYWLLLFLNTMTCVWYMTACDEQGCKFKKRYKSTILRYAESNSVSQLIAYSYVVNLFTATGMRDSPAISISQLFASIIIIFGSVFIVGLITGSVASICIITNHKMSEYENDVDALTDYLEVHKVSPILVTTMWSYLILLWKKQSGEATPVLICKAPPYLKQDIMMGLYGRYIETHYLFANTHVDFIRQLVCYLNRVLFFPGNIVVEKGDMDGSIYFIHSGEVERYNVVLGNYVLQRILSQGSSFGETQLLFNTPHKHTFKAMTTVEMVVLHRKDFNHLIKFFPASKKEIEKKAKSNKISTSNSQIIMN